MGLLSNPRNILVYISQSSTYIVPLLLIPYLGNVLSLEKVGLYVLFQVLLNYGVAAGEYSFQTVSVTKIVKTIDAKDQFEYFVNVLASKAILAFSSALFIGIYVSISHPEVDLYYIYFLILAVSSNLFNSTWLMIANQTLHFQSFVNLIFKISNLAFCLITVRNDESFAMAIASLSISNILFNISTLIIVLQTFKKQGIMITRINPDRKKIAHIIWEGWSIFKTQIFGVIIANFGILYLAASASQSVVGGFGIVDRILKAMSGIYGPFSQIIYPKVSKSFSENYLNGRKVFVGYFTKAMIFGGFVTLLAVLFFKTTIFTVLMGEKFSEFGDLVFAFAPWIFFSLINNMLGLQYMVNNSLGDLYSKIYSLSVCLCILMTILLYGPMGYVGIAVALSINEFILFLILAFYVFRNDLSKRKGAI